MFLQNENIDANIKLDKGMITYGKRNNKITRRY